jgi:colicin import membrane protein
MKVRRVRASLLIILLTAFGVARAQAPGERERIVAERAAANARFAEQNRACQENFVVTSCVEAARKEQRLTLARLHRAELVLDDAERREAAARHRQELQERASAQDSRASQPAPAEVHESTRAPPEPNRPVAPQHERAASSPAERRAEEQRNELRFAERVRAAQERREAVERRNAKRASEGKVAQPLPMPSGASSGASAP